MPGAIVGYVVFYDGEYDGGAFIPKGQSYLTTKNAMQSARPNTNVKVKVVDEIPEWVEEA